MIHRNHSQDTGFLPLFTASTLWSTKLRPERADTEDIHDKYIRNTAAQVRCKTESSENCPSRRTIKKGDQQECFHRCGGWDQQLASSVDPSNDVPPIQESEIKTLTHALIHVGDELQAREQVRGLIEMIVLTPKDTDDDLSIDLYGDLAGILRIATEDKTMKVKGTIEKRLDIMIVNDNHNIEPSVQLVAGVGFEPTTFGL